MPQRVAFIKIFRTGIDRAIGRFFEVSRTVFSSIRNTESIFVFEKVHGDTEFYNHQYMIGRVGAEASQPELFCYFFLHAKHPHRRFFWFK